MADGEEKESLGKIEEPSDKEEESSNKEEESSDKNEELYDKEKESSGEEKGESSGNEEEETIPSKWTTMPVIGFLLALNTSWLILPRVKAFGGKYKLLYSVFCDCLE